MSKEMYLEMCQQLGSEPVDSEMPLDLEDFPELVQTAFTVYAYLPDLWDTMGGNYLGKDYGTVFQLLSLYKVEQEELLLCLEFLRCMDNVRSKIIAEKLKAKSSNTKK